MNEAFFVFSSIWLTLAPDRFPNTNCRLSSNLEHHMTAVCGWILKGWKVEKKEGRKFFEKGWKESKGSGNKGG